MARGSLAAARQLHAELGARRDARKQRPSSNLSSGYQVPQVWRYRALRFTAPQRRRRKERWWKRVGTVERVEESSSSRRAVPKVSSITHKARDPHREKAQREKVGQRMGVGRVAGRISVTNARMDNLATKVKRDILESDRLEVYKQWVRI